MDRANVLMVPCNFLGCIPMCFVILEDYLNIVLDLY